MSVKTYITDPSTGIRAAVVDGIEEHALVVATRPLKTFNNDARFFVNDDYGANMNINASPTGTPLPVHDGTDTTLWTGTTVSGASTVDFDKTEHPRTGSKSIKVEEEVDVVWQIANGADLDMTNYVSLTIWIYVDKNWKAGDSVSIYGWDSATGTQIGDTLYLQDYFDYLTQDVYQKITIPMADFGALAGSTIMDAFRQRIVAEDGKRAKFFMDDIELEGVDDTPPSTFSVKADKGTWLYVDEFTVSIASDINGTLADATMPFLSYDSLLGTTLTSGINYQRKQDGEIVASNNVKTILDFLQTPSTEITAQGSDGVNTWVTLRAKYTEPLILKSEDEDELSFTVSDDLSGLLHLRISAGGKIEQRY
jgi:hypothetical protein